jgi:hypothetical protein
LATKFVVFSVIGPLGYIGWLGVALTLRHVEFVVEKLALVKVFLIVILLWFSTVNPYVP